jgi:hypothetical protein
MISCFIHFKNEVAARRWWLTSAILGTQEIEIRRIMVQGQPWQIICETLSQKYSIQKKGWQSGSSGTCRANMRPQVQTPILTPKVKVKLQKTPVFKNA